MKYFRFKYMLNGEVQFRERAAINLFSAVCAFTNELRGRNYEILSVENFTTFTDSDHI